MAKFRGRSVRTALLATALMTVVAVPAAAMPASSHVGPVEAKKVRKAQAETYSLAAEIQGKRGLAKGSITIADNSVTNDGTVSDPAQGKTTITFTMKGAAGTKTVSKNTTSNGLVSTDFTRPGEFDSVTIRLCKVYPATGGDDDCDETTISA